jgi:hypothetical protein
MTHAILALVIDHASNRISYRSALSPHDLDARATIHVETRNRAAIARVLEAIDATQTIPDARAADLRYAIRLRDARGVARTIYLDAFGTRGTLDGKPVRFASDAIKRAIVSMAPALTR